jgi:tetratricopeptide (TPR) repeat protein
VGSYFFSTQPDHGESLKYYQRAYYLAESIGYATDIHCLALRSISNIQMITGNLLDALLHAKKAYRCSQRLANIFEQAYSLYAQGSCHISLGNYVQAQHVLKLASDMLNVCGQEKSYLGRFILTGEAEIHLVKTEYHESRRMQAEVAAKCQPGSYEAVLASMNITLIDINTGVDSKYICNNLDITQSHVSMLFGYLKQFPTLFIEYLVAEISLRDGAHETAKEIFEPSFKSNLNIDQQIALLCCEKLGDLSTGMNDISTTLQWAGILLSLASKYKDKLFIMHAFQHLGQIFSARGDDETALSLFTVALDGFTLMDVHRWRADCKVRIADILNSRGESTKAVELWKAARPLFEQSSQIKDVTKLDEKLAQVDPTVLADYEKNLLQLAELQVPVNTPDKEEDQEEEEEEEEKDKSHGKDKVLA